MANLTKLKSIISNSPDAPGVYLMKDASGGVLYVGKAKSLKKRLQTYLSRDLSAKTVAMISQVYDIKYRLTPSEALALLLEAALIRQYKPKYNVALRDDKSFPLVKITNEEFPAIFITRKKLSDGTTYIGPFTNAGLLREALKVIRRYFPYRSCKTLPKKACVYYRIGLSPAPCIGKISRSDYAKTIENISLLLEGRSDVLLEKLKIQMQEESFRQNYELAARIRDQLNALSAIGTIRASCGSSAELDDLRRALKLKQPPLRIEAFDISNIYGKEACGSMVSFFKGLSDKDNYRRFRIKTVERIDDYAMLKEVIRRRYIRLKEEKLPLPDLLLIDGGKGQLAVAKEVLAELNLEIPAASIAKAEEHIYLCSGKEPLKLEEGRPALNLIRRLRDEAHRFAVSYHHLLRRKKVIGE